LDSFFSLLKSESVSISGAKGGSMYRLCTMSKSYREKRKHYLKLRAMIKSIFPTKSVHESPFYFRNVSERRYSSTHVVSYSAESSRAWHCPRNRASSLVKRFLLLHGSPHEFLQCPNPFKCLSIGRGVLRKSIAKKRGRHPNEIREVFDV